MDLSFANSVSGYNLHFSRRSLCDRKYVLYLCVSGFRDDRTLSRVVNYRVRFYLYIKTPHLFANISVLIPWCCLYVYMGYPLLVLLTLTLLINMSTIKSWDIPMETFAIALSNSKISNQSLNWIFGSALGILLSTILM